MGLELGIPYLSQLSYLAIPLSFLLASVGFPILEEAILLVVGYLAFASTFNLGFAMVVSVLSIIVVDNLHFFLGTHGHLLLKRLCAGATLERVRAAVNRHGFWSVFVARFVPGMRILTPWVASTSGMRWRTFTLANALGAMVQTPLIITVGSALGPHVARGLAFVQSVHDVVPVLLLIALVLAAIAVCLFRKSARQYVCAVLGGGQNGRV